MKTLLKLRIQKYLLVLLTILLTANSFSQPPSYSKPGGEKSGIISGTIIDESSHPLEFATIALYKSNDNALVTGAITDVKGSFEIKNLSFGSYYIKIKFIGYEEKEISDIKVTPNNPKLNLNKITLELSANEIEGVEVVADRKFVEYKLDKKIVNVSQDIASSGGTAVEVLETAPSIQVDVDGNVSLRGSQSFTVYIDGKPTILDANDVLQQTPASSIENIELITNPSAKYDPDGVAGIINIVMKKKAQTGLTGITSITTGTPKEYGGDILLNYRSKHFNVFGSADVSQRTRNGSRHFDRYYYDENDLDKKTFDSIIWEDGDRVRERENYDLKAGIDLYLSEKTTVTLSGGLGQYKNYGDNGLNKKIDTDILSKSNLGNVNYDIFNLIEDSSGRSGNYHSFNFDFNHKFQKEGHKIDGGFYYRFRDGDDYDYKAEYITDELFGNRIKDIDYIIGEPGVSKDYRFKLDYVLPLTNKSKFEAGYQVRIEDEEENYFFDTTLYNNASGETPMDNELKYLFNNNIQSGYAIYSGQFGNFQYQAGVRTEYTLRVIDVIGDDFKSTVDRFDFFPSFHSSYQFNKELQMMASYTKRIERPGGWRLEPYDNFSDLTSIRRGNVDLLPEYIASYELGIQKSKGMNYVSIEAFFRNTKNHIEYITTNTTVIIKGDTTKARLLTFDNFNEDGKLYNFGLEASGNYEPLKWLRLTGSFSYYYIFMDGIVNGDTIKKNEPTFDLRFMPMFKITPTTRLQLTMFYRGDQITSMGKRNAMFFTNLGLRQDLFKRKVTASLQLRDIFATSYFEFENYSKSFEEIGRFSRDSRTVMLTLTYKINNFKPQKQRNMEGGDGGGGDFDGGGEF